VLSLALSVVGLASVFTGNFELYLERYAAEYDARGQHLRLVRAHLWALAVKAVLGVLAGSLASFFRLGDNGKANGPPPDQPASPAATASDVALQALTSEVAALRRQMEALTTRLTGAPGDLTANEPSSGEDAAG